MKKHLSIILRFVVAAAGLAYIAVNLDWTDKVEFPVHAQAPGGRVLIKREAFRVVTADFDPNQLPAALTVTLDPRDPAAPTAVVTRDRFGARDEADRYLLRPGLKTTLRHARLDLLLLGLVLVGPIYPIISLRWWMLMRVRGLEVSRWRAFRLSMVGAFFNYCMPGSTGGDLVKAYYAAKRTDRRADAVMTVVFDRIVGLLALVLMAGLAGLFMLDDRIARHLMVYVWLVIAGIIAASAVYFSHRLRVASGLDWLLSKFPPESLPAKLDRAAVAYRDHKMTVLTTILMSLPVQVLVALSTAATGYALGMKTPVAMLMTVVPLLFLVGAVPISYQGFGIMEGVALALLNRPPFASANQIVVMLLMARVYQIVYSLIGSAFLLRGDIHMHPDAAAPEPEPIEQRVTQPV